MRLKREAPTPEQQARKAGRRDALRIIVAAAVVTVIVLLALDNRQEVTVGWLAGETDMPLYLLFVGTFALGIVVGLVLRVRRRHH